MHTLAQDPIAMTERLLNRARMPSVLDSLAGESMQAKVARLSKAMRAMPQAEGLETEHYFVPGMYCRKLARKAGVVIEGKVHKAPHFFLCAAGEILVLTDDGKRTLKAGDVIECHPGTKRITVALVDSVGVTIHKTDKTDLAEIEAELIEPDETALFDAGNAIKALLEGTK